MPRTQKSPPRPAGRLAQLRRKRQLTLDEVARHCGADKCQVSRWERLINEPRADNRARYAEILGITVAQLGAILWEERRLAEGGRG